MLLMLPLLRLRRSAASSADALLHLLKERLGPLPLPLPPSVERLLLPSLPAMAALALAPLAGVVSSPASPSH